MGREIERILLDRGHTIPLIIDTHNTDELDAAHLQGIDVALEFTTPQRRTTTYAAASRRVSPSSLALRAGRPFWTS